MRSESPAKRFVKVLQAKAKVSSLRSKNGCEYFNELVNGIRSDIESNVYSYAQIGVTEIELLELGLCNARLYCISGSSNILANQRIVQLYIQELAQLHKKSGSTTVCFA